MENKREIKPIKIKISEREKALIDYMRIIGYGEIHLSIKNKEPYEIIESQKSMMIDKELLHKY